LEALGFDVSPAVAIFAASDDDFPVFGAGAGLAVSTGFSVVDGETDDDASVSPTRADVDGSDVAGGVTGAVEAGGVEAAGGANGGCGAEGVEGAVAAGGVGGLGDGVRTIRFPVGGFTTSRTYGMATTATMPRTRMTISARNHRAEKILRGGSSSYRSCSGSSSG